MGIKRSQSGCETEGTLSDCCFVCILRFIVKHVAGLPRLLAPRAYSAIIFAALFCTLAVKFFHSWRTALLSEYFGWIAADIAVLLGIEVVLAITCFRRPRKPVTRTACVIAAVVCTWSVMNAGWLIRTGTQILPTVLLPLFRAPLNSLGIVGINLVKMPATAVILLAPSAIALGFLFFVLARPTPPNYNRKRFGRKILISVVIIIIAVVARPVTARRGSAQIVSEGLRSNCQLSAVISFFSSDSHRLTKADLANPGRKIPAFDELKITLPSRPQQVSYNVVIVVLEGIQYGYTSLADKQGGLTPHLAALAESGVEFTNTRSALTHTTKVLFSLLTGRFPSVSQDLAEAVPAAKPYAGIATILKRSSNFRTAFFQSAKGNFECRPGLVYNLGFDKFWARDDLNDPNAFLGYLACDEFSMLEPITKWIKADESPFLLTILCSVTHDPYEVPEWFAASAKDPVARYRQAVFYTDKFIAALDVELARLNLTDKTIFCVIGDHGEAFGEHGLLGHERIAFEEALRVPWVIRAPFSVGPAAKVTKPVSSVDLTPTILALLGFETADTGLDGLNALGSLPDDRRVYFSSWLRQSPAGFVKGTRKFIYDPTYKTVSVYDLGADPSESFRIELSQQEGQKVADEIITWRRSSVFHLDQQRTGRTMLFDRWLCRWTNRVSSAKYRPLPKN